MSVQPNIYPLRIDKSIMSKAKFIAKENGRSLNKEIETLLKRHIANYEKVNGTIFLEEE